MIKKIVSAILVVIILCLISSVIVDILNQNGGAELVKGWDENSLALKISSINYISLFLFVIPLKFLLNFKRNKYKSVDSTQKNRIDSLNWFNRIFLISPVWVIFDDKDQFYSLLIFLINWVLFLFYLFVGIVFLYINSSSVPLSVAYISELSVVCNY